MKLALQAEVKRAAPSRGQRIFSLIRVLYSQPASAVGTSIFLLFLILALVGPLIAPYGMNEQIVADVRQAPSAAHWFGTDHLARDVFSRVILGARDILVLAGAGSLISVLFGTLLGLFSGYRGGWLDELLMRIFDSFLSIPALLLALLLLGTIGPSREGVFVVIVFIYTPIVSRVVRSVVLGVKSKSYIEAALTRGESTRYILWREILPSVMPVLTVETALRFSYSIFLAASLGFLGVGVQPPNPDWGLMVNEARRTYAVVPWALYFPAGAISLIVIGVNLMADGLERALQEKGT